MGFERVHTVWDYNDCPRTGLADYDGRPHYYSSNWDNLSDDYANSYTLSEVDDVTLRLALDQWAIWKEWEKAFHLGLVPQESHPGFGGKDARYDELDMLLKEKISLGRPLPFKVRADFRVKADRLDLPRGYLHPLEVEWVIIADPSD
jgi:hypothetical protein